MPKKDGRIVYGITFALTGAARNLPAQRRSAFRRLVEGMVMRTEVGLSVEESVYLVHSLYQSIPGLPFLHAQSFPDTFGHQPYNPVIPELPQQNCRLLRSNI
jgi:hypothetical protein